MENRTVDVFLTELASGAPTPGGGGASAVCGAIAAALGSMVGNLTSGKKKYAEYQEEIEVAIGKCGKLVKEFEELGKKDEEVFEPLAKAYSIPKDQEGRDEILEAMKEAHSFAISDVGVAAAACGTAAKGAAMNVYINTKSMKDRAYAEDLNRKTIELVDETSAVCAKVYEQVKTILIGG